MVVSTQKYPAGSISTDLSGPGGFSGYGLPLVSILMPTHNRPDYAELALQSALAQTHPRIENIVNDNRDDLLPQERFAPYLARHSRIHCARVHGCGVMENFQYCYARSAGEYINYLMDDDLFHPGKIQKMRSFALAKPSVGLMTSFHHLIDADGHDLLSIAGAERRFEVDTLIEGVRSAPRFSPTDCT